MGAWGLESSSNDNCWDMIGNALRNASHDGVSLITPLTAVAIANYAYKHLISKKREKPTRYGQFTYRPVRKAKEAALGCVVHLLAQGCTVQPKILKVATAFAKQLLRDKEYLANWRGDRAQVLRQEIAAMRAASEEGGRERSATFLVCSSESVQRVRQRYGERPHRDEGERTLVGERQPIRSAVYVPGAIATGHSFQTIFGAVQLALKRQCAVQTVNRAGDNVYAKFQVSLDYEQLPTPRGI